MCLFFHKWSNWKELHKVKVYDSAYWHTQGVCSYYELAQYKECSECGKIKIRTIKY